MTSAVSPSELSTLFQLRPPSTVDQSPCSVTIQPDDSPRKNSETGCSFTSYRDQCRPLSLVTTTTPCWRSFLSVMTPAAIQRWALGQQCREYRSWNRPGHRGIGFSSARRRPALRAKQQTEDESEGYRAAIARASELTAAGTLRPRGQYQVGIFARGFLGFETASTGSPLARRRW